MQKNSIARNNKMDTQASSWKLFLKKYGISYNWNDGSISFTHFTGPCWLKVNTTEAKILILIFILFLLFVISYLFLNLFDKHILVEVY